MYSLEDIFDLFPDLTETQKAQIIQLGPIYTDWNQRINVISRKDMAHFYSRHVLYSLSIGLYFDLSGKTVLDVGTGGGFPGVPLAILFPDARFSLLDSIGKKLKVIDAVADEIGLQNIQTIHGRMEDQSQRYDVITGRAVKSFPQMYQWLSGHFKGKARGTEFLYLKGGDFGQEMKEVPMKREIIPLKDKLDKDEFFSTKNLVRFYT